MTDPTSTSLRAPHFALGDATSAFADAVEQARAEEWARQQGCSVVRLWSSSVRTAAHRFYEDLGYTNIKTQYSFMKSVDTTGQEVLRKFVPQVDE